MGALTDFEPPEAPIQSCLTCRITGTVVFSGVAGWLIYERSRIPVSSRGHRALLVAMSGAFCAAAVARSLW